MYENYESSTNFEWVTFNGIVYYHSKKGELNKKDYYYYGDKLKSFNAKKGQEIFDNYHKSKEGVNNYGTM